MLYYVFRYLEEHFNLPGAGVFQYISFRAALAVILSLTISLLFGKRLIALLQKKQVAETIRDLGLQGEEKKRGTPTMGGLIILAAILIPTLLFARLRNVYVLLIVIVTVLLGLIGFIDDYIKIFKKDKRGLAGRFKVIGQILVGLIVGLTLFFNQEVVVRKVYHQNAPAPNADWVSTSKVQTDKGDALVVDMKSTKTTVPFFKTHEFDYANLLFFLDKETANKYSWIVYVLIVIFIITAVSNGANLTDGIDGLAAGLSGIICPFLHWSSFLNLLFQFFWVVHLTLLCQTFASAGQHHFVCLRSYVPILK